MLKAGLGARPPRALSNAASGRTATSALGARGGLGGLGGGGGMQQRMLMVPARFQIPSRRTLCVSFELFEKCFEAPRLRFKNVSEQKSQNTKILQSYHHDAAKGKLNVLLQITEILR